MPRSIAQASLVAQKAKNPPVMQDTWVQPQVAKIHWTRQWLPTPVFFYDRWITEKAREFQKNTYFCFIYYTKAFDYAHHNKLWKVLQEMEIPDHFTSLLRNLYAGQEATVRNRHETAYWFQIWKAVHKGCILSPCLFNLYAEYLMWNTWLAETQAGIKIAGRNINNLRYADDTTLKAEIKEEPKSLLMKVKEENKKAGLKLNIQKTKILASNPITSWQIDGKTMETVTDLACQRFSWAPKSLQLVTVGHEIKKCLPLGRKAMTNLDSILKSKVYFGNKGPSRQSYGFSSSHVWMWELDSKESCLLKNRCFSTVVLEKTLESPLDCKEIQPVHPKENQSWILIGRTDAESETLILWPRDAKNWLIGKDPNAGKYWK